MPEDMFTPTPEAAAAHARDHAHPDLPASFGIRADDVDGATEPVCPGCDERDCWPCGVRRAAARVAGIGGAA